MVLHSAVVAYMIMAMIGVAVGQFITSFIVGDENASFTSRCYLKEIERIRTTLSEESHGCPLIARTECLASVLYQCQVVFLAEGDDLVNTGHPPAHMHQEHRLGFGSNGGLNPFRTKAQGFVDFREHRQTAAE